MQNLTIEEAEKLAGKRLDRRRTWFLFDGDVCYDGKFVRPCSGCFETGEYGSGSENYPFDKKAGCHVGSGCEECGYTGKRRDGFPIPHDFR
jgi:hypothetical protein